MQKDACGAMLLFQVVVQSLHLKAMWGTHLSAPPAVGKGSLRAFCVRNGKRVQEVCSSTACVSCGGATNILHLVDENNKAPWLHQVLRAAFASWAVLAWFLLVFSCTNCTMFVQGEWGAPVWCAWPRSVLWFLELGLGWCTQLYSCLRLMYAVLGLWPKVGDWSYQKTPKHYSVLLIPGWTKDVHILHQLLK